MAKMTDDPVTLSTLDAVRHFNEAFDRHDVDGVMAAMTEDCVFENTCPPPDGEWCAGQGSVRTFRERFFTSSPASKAFPPSGSQMAMAGADPFAIMEAMSHADINTTMIYVSLGKSHIREQVERLNTIQLPVTLHKASSGVNSNPSLQDRRPPVATGDIHRPPESCIAS